MSIRKICCIGAGYVGGPTMAVVADRCPGIQVTVVDLNQSRIDAWNDSDLSKLPVYEPGLDIVIGRCRGRNLFFSTAVEPAIASADMVFLSVNTPTKTKGVGAGQASDLCWIEASARQVAAYAQGHTIVVEKSTLPVRTAETIKSILSVSKCDSSDGTNNTTFSVLSNPEFLAEGSAISDLEHPDRVLIGGEEEDAIETLASIYLNWVPNEKILRTNLWSSELSKLTANAFLAQRISSINSISALCEATGADIHDVAVAIGSDSRIGPKFLKAGPGFGGSCFQKDILNDVAAYWKSVVDLNSWQQHRISRIVVQRLFGTVSGKRIAVLGFAFKANTNDTRESPAIQICNDLLDEGAQLLIYDPQASSQQINDKLSIVHEPASWNTAESPIQAVHNADAVLILTEWQDFAELNWQQIADKMRRPAWVFDTRSIVDVAAVRSCDLNLWRVGMA